MKRTSLKMLTILLLCASCGNSPEANSGKANETSAPTAKNEQAEAKVVKVGEHLQAEYFDIVVNNAEIAESINTGNEFSSVPPEEGVKFVVIDIAVKNTDAETRMMFEGEVLVNQDGKLLKYENAEMIMAEGYGMIMENINPGITKKTKLVYKIPSDLKGNVFYHPARSENEALIILGSI